MTDVKAKLKIIMDKSRPVHNFNITKALLSRQLGQRTKISNSVFQRSFNESLHAVQRLRLSHTLEGQIKGVSYISFNETGNLLLGAYYDATIYIWDWMLQKKLVHHRTMHKGEIIQSKFLRLLGDYHVVTCGTDGQIKYVHIAHDGVRLEKTVRRNKNVCNQVAVSKEEPQIFYSIGDNRVTKHDLRTSSRDHAVLIKSLSDIYSIDVNPIATNEFCVSGTIDKIFVYDQRNCGQILRYHTMYNYSVPYYLTYSHDGSEILATYREAIYLYTVKDAPGEHSRKYEGSRCVQSTIEAKFMGSKSNYIVTGSECGNLFFWDKQTEAVVQVMTADNIGEVLNVECHPHMPYLTSCGLDNDIKVWMPLCDRQPRLRRMDKIIEENLLEMFENM